MLYMLERIMSNRSINLMKVSISDRISELELHMLFPDDFEYSGTSFTKSILTSRDLLFVPKLH